MQELSSTSSLIAIVAALLATIAIVAATILFVKLRRLRQAQRIVLGDGDRRDVTEHAQTIEAKCNAMGEFVQELLERLDEHTAETRRRLDRSFGRSAIVRYDAYGEMSGRQSHSIALLDDRGTGLVLSTIMHRDQARVYVKRLDAGTADIRLSPEESAAVEIALGHRPQPDPMAADEQLQGRAAS